MPTTTAAVATSASTIHINAPVELESAFWADVIDQATTSRNGAAQNKRRRVSPEPASAPANDDRILLIHRNISLKIKEEYAHPVFDCLNHRQATVSVKVICDFCSTHINRDSHSLPSTLKLTIYPAVGSTPLLGLTFNSLDIADGWEEVNFVMQVHKDSKKKPPLTEFQSEVILTLARGEKDQWSCDLSMKVTMDAANKWSDRSLALSRKFYWKLLARGLPVGRPIIQEAMAPRDFYLSVHVPEKTERVPQSVQHWDLSCELLPFQRRAVQWMLRREGVELAPNGSGFFPFTNRLGSSLPPTFFKQSDRNGNPCFVSHILGIASRDLEGLRKLTERQDINGGILAEEMGLGKTVELLALLCLHRRHCTPGETVRDDYHDRDVKTSGATLIITPPSILHQWQTEITRHAPGLRVYTYEGVKRSKDPDALAEEFTKYDIVITTYNVLSAEIYFTQPPPTRSLRHQKVYKAKRSPLVEISWWRVCLDEAQMVENGVSNAAIVAREIPRVNAWCVTGTPVRKDIDDCFGLLLFLRYEPFCRKDVWLNLVRYNHVALRSLLGYLVLRNSKDILGDEISLPSQNRVVVTIPFSQVEEQNYQQLFAQMCEECCVDSAGVRNTDDWNPTHYVDKMRTWLVRLRQTCLHPEAGERNRRAFGLKSGPLRTVEEVLSVMIEQHTVQMRTNQRTLFSSMIKRGQLYESTGDTELAMACWQEALELVKTSVVECREALAEEIRKANESSKEAQKYLKGKLKAREDKYEDDGDQPEKRSKRVGTARNRLKSFLELEHACCFWVASAYYQMGDRDRSKAGAKDGPQPSPEEASQDTVSSEEYRKKESEYYELAKALRLELMHETRTRALTYISNFEKKKEQQSFVEVPDILPPEEAAGGIESQTILDSVVELAGILNEQAIVLDEFREKLISLLIEPLVDQDDDKELEGNEIEVSVEKQEESYAYMSAVRALLADREASLTEVHNQLIEQDVATAMKRPGKIHNILFGSLIGVKDKVNPTNGYKSMRRLLNEFRTLISGLKQSEEGGNNRAQMERAIAEKEYKKLQKTMATQTKVVSDLFKEVELFRNASNARMEFYRQVQAISDTVLPIDIEKEYGVKSINNTLFKKITHQEASLQKKITETKSRNRYLTHLTGKKAEERPTCLICLDVYEIGIISNCGHSFCKDCILIWRKTAQNCPACKAHLRPADFFQVTYSPAEIAMQKENQETSPQGSTPSSPGGGNIIYADVDDRVLREIKSIELGDSSYGSKIDMITRHMLWLKQNEPGFKAVVFSQWGDVLEVIKGSLRRSNIGFASLEKDSINKFRHDPDISCFLLHAKSQSAGLTLVNATHVFLCEPLLNVGLELQAVSRVHRIGQERTTTVWLYCINNTVEQSVLDLATRRRMSFIGKTSDGDTPILDAAEKRLIDEKLDAAESDELREGLARFIDKAPGGGERVLDEDLWSCLFGKGTVEKPPARHQLAVRELMAHAAEQRMAGPSGTR